MKRGGPEAPTANRNYLLAAAGENKQSGASWPGHCARAACSGRRARSLKLDEQEGREEKRVVSPGTRRRHKKARKRRKKKW